MKKNYEIPQVEVLSFESVVATEKTASTIDFPDLPDPTK